MSPGHPIGLLPLQTRICKIRQSYARDGETVDLFIADYARQAQGTGNDRL